LNEYCGGDEKASFEHIPIENEFGFEPENFVVGGYERDLSQNLCLVVDEVQYIKDEIVDFQNEERKEERYS
jgi:hypothetical protein